MLNLKLLFHVLIRPLHFADGGCATCFSVFWEKIVFILHSQTFCISLFFPDQKNNMRMSNLFVMLSYECDNQLYIVMVHFSTALPKQDFIFIFIFFKWGFCLFSAFTSSLEVHIYCTFYTHTGIILLFSISKLLFLHLFYCSITCSCSW